jgi:excisionase family DNA binding protein
MPPACPGFFIVDGMSESHVLFSVTTLMERRLIVPADGAKPTITPAWLDYKQAEAYSSLSRTTLWQLINARKIKAARIGRAVRIERLSLDKFMQESSL